MRGIFIPPETDEPHFLLLQYKERVDVRLAEPPPLRLVLTLESPVGNC